MAVLLAWNSHTFAAKTLAEVEVQPDRVLATPDGQYHFTLIQGDYVNNGARAMVREDLTMRLPKEEWVYYDFGVEIPSDWPFFQSKDALIVQWRNGYGSPYFAIHLSDGRFYVRQNSNPVQKFYARAHPDGVENNFHIMAKWSETDHGRFVAIVNGRKIVDFTGRTLNKNGEDPYFSFGLYRPQWNMSLRDASNRLSIVFTRFDYGIMDGGAPDN